MVKSKLMLPILAVIVGVAASAFTISPLKKGNQANVVYKYISPDQSADARKTASNYEKGTTTCSGSVNECAVTLNQDFGNTPDFTNVTFDGSGFPIGGSAFVSNAKMP
ncbi:MAG TPA: hypothetical protein VIU45_08165 [Chitinophagaceae bacterium]